MNSETVYIVSRADQSTQDECLRTWRVFPNLDAAKRAIEATDTSVSGWEWMEGLDRERARTYWVVVGPRYEYSIDEFSVEIA